MNGESGSEDVITIAMFVGTFFVPVVVGILIARRLFMKKRPIAGLLALAFGIVLGAACVGFFGSI
jgi:hypothetical protein